MTTSGFPTPGREAPGWEAFGASVRGPAHVADNLPNQDAWTVHRSAAGMVAVVCDGLGSKHHSDIGARMACRATVDAVAYWAHTPSAPPLALFRLIHALWAVRLGALVPESAATTCLLAFASATAPYLLLAQLGDGLVLADAPGHPPTSLLPGPDRFSNTTTGLGIPGSLRSWTWHRIDAPAAGTRVLLATDGIADDLLADRHADFLHHVHRTYAHLPPPLRWRCCAADLRRWPVPRHTDDKTLALLWSPAPDADVP